VRVVSHYTRYVIGGIKYSCVDGGDDGKSCVEGSDDGKQMSTATLMWLE